MSVLEVKHFAQIEEAKLECRVTTRDISKLDPDSTDQDEATWGGLTGFSSQFGDAVRSAANEDQG